MLLNLLLLLLPVAAISGWYAAKSSTAAGTQQAGEKFTRRYLVGLNYLLNEQPDKAVDVFIKMLEIDSEVVETHLALGTLFRRRGEAGRAIRIHQNLIARPNLSKEVRLQALLALGEDYLKAGVLDRAERVLLEFCEVASGELASIGLRHLLDIYQQEKHWESAIKIAAKLAAQGGTYQKNIAHYYCEQALIANAQKQLEQAQRHLKRALESDPDCVRASLLQGEIELAQGKPQMAMQAFQRAVQQDADYLTEILPELIKCYECLGDKAAMLVYLSQCLKQHPRTSLILAMTDYLPAQEAIAFLAQQLQQRPSLRGLQRLISMQLNTATDAESHTKLQILYDLTSSLLNNKAAYRCTSCGFNSKVLHWLCPGCHHWGSIKAIQGPEGD